MQNTGKTLTAILFSAVALALGTCGKEEYGAQSTPEIRTSSGPGGQEGSNLKENDIIDVHPSSALTEAQAGMPSLSEEDSINCKEDSVLKEGLVERIKKVEEYCHVKFPDDYIIFIEEYNVGLPVANTFMANHKNYVIERFLGFVNDYQDSPLGDYDIAVVMAPIETYLTDNPDLVGVELVPIASLSTGDYVCLNFKDNKEEPSVCIWSKAESEEFHPVIYEVADSFLYFAESLE